ncbi:hypothetical protein [Photobacterium lipolyticum]|uniref:Uncharacterized protein n=1 Tax=Photobacterium lipolyticum TaxID=266810 RepID=A0A2T3N441_9GAMM|nr:hypothetical protein [Photobacterium lipolyticum]PSW07213.1 hypothetical protein C9I89_00365 [Photobacterium lipolyticum]
MKVLFAIMMLSLSGYVLAYGGGGSYGGNPAVSTGAVKNITSVCLDKKGKPIAKTQSLKLSRECSLTGVTSIDLTNYDNFYKNKPKNETLADIRKIQY